MDHVFWIMNWQVTVLGVTKSWTRLSDKACSLCLGGGGDTAVHGNSRVVKSRICQEDSIGSELGW